MRYVLRGLAQSTIPSSQGIKPQHRGLHEAFSFGSLALTWQ